MVQALIFRRHYLVVKMAKNVEKLSKIHYGVDFIFFFVRIILDSFFETKAI